MEAIPRPPDGDQNRDGAMLAVFWAPFPITVLVVSLRLLARTMIKGLGADDFLIVVSWVLYTAVLIVSTLRVFDGGTRHLYYLTPQNISAIIKLTWIAASLGALALAAIKTSVALFILRLLGPKATWSKWFLYFNIFVIIVSSIVVSIATFTQCNPPRALWEEVAGAKCWDPVVLTDLTVFISAYGTFLDVALALVPIIIVWNLNLNTKKKVGLCALLGIGLFSSIASGIKTAQLANAHRNPDFTWASFSAYGWTTSEFFLLFVCGSVPALKPLYDYVVKGKRFGPSYFSSKKSGHTDYPNKRSYQRHSDSQLVHPARTSLSSTTGNMTDVKGHKGSADDTIGFNDISVERTFYIESRTNTRSRDEEIDATNHRTLV